MPWWRRRQGSSRKCSEQNCQEQSAPELVKSHRQDKILGKPVIDGHDTLQTFNIRTVGSSQLSSLLHKIDLARPIFQLFCLRMLGVFLQMLYMNVHSLLVSASTFKAIPAAATQCENHTVPICQETHGRFEKRIAFGHSRVKTVT